MAISIRYLSQPEADKVDFHFIAFVNVNGQLYEFGKHATFRFPEVVFGIEDSSVTVCVF